MDNTNISNAKTTITNNSKTAQTQKDADSAAVKTAQDVADKASSAAAAATAKLAKDTVTLNQDIATLDKDQAQLDADVAAQNAATLKTNTDTTALNQANAKLTTDQAALTAALAQQTTVLNNIDLDNRNIKIYQKNLDDANNQQKKDGDSFADLLKKDASNIDQQTKTLAQAQQKVTDATLLQTKDQKEADLLGVVNNERLAKDTITLHNAQSLLATASTTLGNDTAIIQQAELAYSNAQTAYNTAEKQLDANSKLADNVNNENINLQKAAQKSVNDTADDVAKIAKKIDKDQEVFDKLASHDKSRNSTAVQDANSAVNAAQKVLDGANDKLTKDTADLATIAIADEQAIAKAQLACNNQQIAQAQAQLDAAKAQAEADVANALALARSDAVAVNIAYIAANSAYMEAQKAAFRVEGRKEADAKVAVFFEAARAEGKRIANESYLKAQQEALEQVEQMRAHYRLVKKLPISMMDVDCSGDLLSGAYD